MALNNAAWMVVEKQPSLKVKPATLPTPGDNELVIETRAVAINPVDWKLQKHAFFPIPYPNIIGEDLAGTVHAVGSSAGSTFKVGDRVIAHTQQLASHDPTDGAFQNYAKVNATITAKIPDSIQFNDAVVLPLAINTAAAGLFQEDYLGLPYPTIDPKSTGTTLLVWGGSSSVGTQAIQLARAAGVEVITTVSPRNNDLVQSLGVTKVFDYTRSTVVDEIVDHLKGKTVAGAFDAISADGTGEKCGEILSRSKGGKFIAATLYPPEKLPEGVSGKFIWALNVLQNAVSPAVWKAFLPEALAKGILKPAPKAVIVGKGLDYIQKGFELNEKGMSAAKAVIEL